MSRLKNDSKTKILDPSELRSIIRDVPNFPKEGIIFKDITPLLQDPAAFRSAVDILSAYLKKKKIEVIIGIESRGFIFSAALAYKLKVDFVPVRKQGKLPYRTRHKAYSLEYGEAVVEVHEDAISPGARVAIVDDLLATGGTALATAQLAEELSGKVVTITFVIELGFLKGREKLSQYDVYSIIQY